MVALLLVAQPTRAAEDTPTFNQDVGRILLDNCASCHRPNQVAPMSLLTYDESRPWARAIKSKVESREMPPWFADPRFGIFSNDISLTDEEIATIVAWADGGAPQGDGAAPAPPQFSEAGWSHPSGVDPDYVIDFPIEVDGRTLLVDLSKQLGVDLTNVPASTVGGLILEDSKRFLEEGEFMEYAGLRFTVVERESRRLSRISISKPQI